MRQSWRPHPPTLKLGTGFLPIFFLFFSSPPSPKIFPPPYFINLLPQSCPYLQRHPSLQHPITPRFIPFLDTFRHASSPHRLLSGDRPASSSAVVLNCASSLFRCPFNVRKIVNRNNVQIIRRVSCPIPFPNLSALRCPRYLITSLTNFLLLTEVSPGTLMMSP